MAITTEVKFIVSRPTATEIGEWVSGELDPDPHAAEADGYRISSLYFDTSEFDTFFGRASYARAKYRIRRYNDSPVVFLERKLKKAGRVVKRRSEFALGDLPQTYTNEISEGWWFWRRLERRRLQLIIR
jgi:SPX domain protein involved in polyphosphate accumulation